MVPLQNDTSPFPVKKVIHPHEVDGVLDSLWVSFCNYMGIPTEENPSPDSGYKYEKDVTKRDYYIGQAIRMRNSYADLMTRFGKDHERLNQMTREISSPKAGARWE